MYVEAILIGLLIGTIRNGRITHFNAARFKGWGLAFFAFLLFVSPYVLVLFGVDFEAIQWLPFGAMGIVALVALVNFDRKGMKWIFLGTAMNMVVMGLNSGFMPMDIVRMQALGFESFAESVSSGMVINYMDVREAFSYTGIFSKIIPLPDFYPFARVLSIGDFVVSIGVAVLIQNEMLLLSMRTKGSMVHFSYRSKIK